MFKTWAFLVAAMSGTTALLGWIEPPSDAPPLRHSFADLMLAVQATIDPDESSPHFDTWRSFTVMDDPRQKGNFLTARSAEPNYHFRIDLNGRLVRMQPWNHQTRFMAEPQAVRIVLERQSAEAPMSRAQWMTIQALAFNLQGASVVTSETYPVRFDAYWSKLYGQGIQIETTPGLLEATHPSSN